MTQTFSILHIGKFYPPEHGGIESVTAALVETHAAQGHTVKVVCFTAEKSEDVATESLTIIRRKAWLNMASQPLGISYLWAALKHSRSADIVHLHAPNILASIAALLLPKKAKLLVHWHADISNKGAIGWLVKPFERLMLKRADVIVCTTQKYAETSKPLARYSEKIRVIPIGIPDHEVNTAPENPLTWAEGRPVVLTVGRLVPYKGLFVLLAAAAKMEIKVAFAIIGTGPLQQPLTEEIARLGLQDNVRLMGRQTSEALDQIFSESTVFCLPSIDRAEAFGVVLLEAMRAGKPVIATNIANSGVSWVNKHGVSGENVTPENATELAVTLTRILSDPDLAKQYGTGARLRFENEFTQDTMTDAFLDAYRKLLLG